MHMKVIKTCDPKMVTTTNGILALAFGLFFPSGFPSITMMIEFEASVFDVDLRPHLRHDSLKIKGPMPMPLPDDYPSTLCDVVCLLCLVWVSCKLYRNCSGGGSWYVDVRDATVREYGIL